MWCDVEGWRGGGGLRRAWGAQVVGAGGGWAGKKMLNARSFLRLQAPNRRAGAEGRSQEDGERWGHLRGFPAGRPRAIAVGLLSCSGLPCPCKVVFGKLLALIPGSCLRWPGDCGH